MRHATQLLELGLYRVIVQAQTSLAVLLNDVHLFHALRLQHIGQAPDAGVPFVRDAGKYERQFEGEFFSYQGLRLGPTGSIPATG
jgi:hypothetical protein